MFGRLFPSWGADYIGRYNMAIIFSFLATLSVWAFWIPLENSVPGIVAFAVLYGVFSGAVVALTPALVAQIWYVCPTHASYCKGPVAYQLVSQRCARGRSLDWHTLRNTGGGDSDQHLVNWRSR